MSVATSTVVRRLLIQAVRSGVTDVSAQVLSARIRTAVARAEAVGFKFVGKVRGTTNQPYLIIYAQCEAEYGHYLCPVELRVFADGELAMFIIHKQCTLFWLRILKSGLVSQTLDFHGLLHSE